MTRVGLTGGNGFVGRHVAAELARRGVDAVLLLRRGAPVAGLPAISFDHHADDPAAAWQAAGRPEVLIHLAWEGLPHYDNLHHIETERPASYRLVRDWVRAGVGHVVVAGTCFEYGLQSGALAESLPCLPANAYGHAKDTLRRDLGFLAAREPFRLTWARLFYLWGDGQAPNSLWPALKAAAARGEREFPMSGGEQLRDYLPVETAARHLVALALQPAGDGIVNVCSGRPVAVRTLVEGWIADNGWPIRPALGRYPYPRHEPMAFWGDDTLLRRRLNEE